MSAQDVRCIPDAPSSTPTRPSAVGCGARVDSGLPVEPGKQLRRQVLCVGAVLRGDDAAGPLLAKMMQDDPIEGWEVLDGGQTPEDFTGVVRRDQPDLLLVVDAASMRLEPGSIRRLSEEDVACDYLMTTHSLPISIMLAELRSSCKEIVFLGIQPGQIDFFSPLTPAVKEAVEWVYAQLASGGDFSCVPAVSESGGDVRAG